MLSKTFIIKLIYFYRVQGIFMVPVACIYTIMINKDNKTTVGVYKGNVEIVKILKNDAVVYQKTSPYPLDNGVYYHKTTGECELTRSSNNNADYDGVVVAKDGVMRGIRLNEYNNVQWGTGLNGDRTKVDDSAYITMWGTQSNGTPYYGSSFVEDYWEMCGCTATQMWNARNDATGTLMHTATSYTNPVPLIGQENQQSYIPSKTELVFIENYITRINAILADLNATPISSKYYWCSEGFTGSNIIAYDPINKYQNSVIVVTTSTVRPFFTVVPPEGTYYYNRISGAVNIVAPVAPQPSQWGVLVSDGARFVISSAYLIDQGNQYGDDYVYGLIDTSLNNIDPFVENANNMTAIEKANDTGLKRTMHHFGLLTTYHGATEFNSYGTNLGNHVHDVCRQYNCYVPSISDLKLLYDYWDEASQKLLTINYNVWRNNISSAGKLAAVIQSCTVKKEWTNWRLYFGNGNAYEGSTEASTDYIIPFCYY